MRLDKGSCIIRDLGKIEVARNQSSKKKTVLKGYEKI